MVRKPRHKAAVEESACVACGCCVKVCPVSAIQVLRGLFARVERDKCVGCGRCVREFPACVIRLEVEEQ